MSPPDQVPDTDQSVTGALALIVTVVPAGAGGVSLCVVAGGTGELHHRPYVVAGPGDVGVDVAVVYREAVALQVSDQ